MHLGYTFENCIMDSTFIHCYNIQAIHVFSIFLVSALQWILLGAHGRRLENAVLRVATVNAHVLVRVNQTMIVQTVRPETACVAVIL